MPAASSRPRLSGVSIRISRPSKLRFSVVASSVHISAPASMPLMRSSHAISQRPPGRGLTMSPCTPPPVELLSTMSQPLARMRLLMSRYTSGLQVAPSSGRRAWMATTLAPAFQQRSTSSAISAGWVGRWGFCDLWAMPPVGAMVTMTLRLLIGVLVENCGVLRIVFLGTFPLSHRDDI